MDAQTEAIIKSDSQPSSKPTWKAEPPAGVRFGTAKYYIKLYESQLKISRKQAELPVSPEDLEVPYVG